MKSKRGAIHATHKIVSREEWLKARKAHLKNEKALTRMRDLVSAERRALPWVKVEKEYVFDTPDGKATLAELFGNNSQLIIHHFMWRWDLGQGCVSCSLEADHAEGALVHLQNHDVSYVRVSRAPIEMLEAYKKRMGWTAKWVSSYGNDFNYDYHVSFTKDELAGQGLLQLRHDRRGSTPSTNCRVSACSSRTRPARCSTPTPATPAATKR